MNQDFQQGVFDISNHEYHHGKYKNLLSNSGIKKLKRSPAHYKAWLEEPPTDPTPALNFGQAYHVYVLENDRFKEKVAIAPILNLRTKDGREEMALFKKSNQGKAIISANDLLVIKDMYEAIQDNSFAANLLKNPLSYEQTYIWKNPDFNFWCKIRVDFEIENLAIIGDLKTTTDASPFGFPRQVANYGYDIQASWYAHGYSCVKNKKLDGFIFLAQEKEPPYAVSTFNAGQDVIMRGWDKIEPALFDYAKCLREDKWPGYPDEVIDLVLPGWA